MIVKKPNAQHKALFTGLFKQRVVQSKKVFKRNAKHRHKTV